MAAALSQVRHGKGSAGGLERQNTAPAMRPRPRPDLGAQSFPPRYSGAFEREQHHEGGTAEITLSPQARSMLSRRFGSAAAGDLIGIVERMAAAAAAEPPGADLPR